MRPLPEQHPSWLSTILVTFLALLFAFVLAVGFANTWLEQVTEISNALYKDKAEYARLAQESDERTAKAIWIAFGFGVAGAVLAAWGWRARRETRFQIAYFSGLGLLVVTFLYVYHGMFVTAVYATGGASDNASWNPGFEFISIPLVALISMATGLVLILSALNFDRRP